MHSEEQEANNAEGILLQYNHSQLTNLHNPILGLLYIKICMTCSI